MLGRINIESKSGSEFSAIRARNEDTGCTGVRKMTNIQKNL